MFLLLEMNGFGLRDRRNKGVFNPYGGRPKEKFPFEWKSQLDLEKETKEVTPWRSRRHLDEWYINQMPQDERDLAKLDQKLRNIDLSFESRFKYWLQGRDRNLNAANVVPWGHSMEEANKKKYKVPLHRNLLLGDDEAQRYVMAPMIKQQDFFKFLAEMKIRGPQNFGEKFLYFKYLVWPAEEWRKYNPGFIQGAYDPFDPECNPVLYYWHDDYRFMFEGEDDDQWADPNRKPPIQLKGFFHNRRFPKENDDREAKDKPSLVGCGNLVSFPVIPNDKETQLLTEYWRKTQEVQEGAVARGEPIPPPYSEQDYQKLPEHMRERMEEQHEWEQWKTGNYYREGIYGSKEHKEDRRKKDAEQQKEDELQKRPVLDETLSERVDLKLKLWKEKEASIRKLATLRMSELPGVTPGSQEEQDIRERIIEEEIKLNQIRDKQIIESGSGEDPIIKTEPISDDNQADKTDYSDKAGVDPEIHSAGGRLYPEIPSSGETATTMKFDFSQMNEEEVRSALFQKSSELEETIHQIESSGEGIPADQVAGLMKDKEILQANVNALSSRLQEIKKHEEDEEVKKQVEMQEEENGKFLLELASMDPKEVENMKQDLEKTLKIRQQQLDTMGERHALYESYNQEAWDINRKLSLIDKHQSIEAATAKPTEEETTPKESKGKEPMEEVDELFPLRTQQDFEREIYERYAAREAEFTERSTQYKEGARIARQRHATQHIADLAEASAQKVEEKKGEMIHFFRAPIWDWVKESHDGITEIPEKMWVLGGKELKAKDESFVRLSTKMPENETLVVWNRSSLDDATTIHSNPGEEREILLGPEERMRIVTRALLSWSNTEDTAHKVPANRINLFLGRTPNNNNNLPAFKTNAVLRWLFYDAKDGKYVPVDSDEINSRLDALRRCLRSNTYEKMHLWVNQKYGQEVMERTIVPQTTAAKKKPKNR